MDFLYFLQGLRNGPLNLFFNLFTYFGHEILVIGILCVFYWCIDKRTAYKVCFTYVISGLMVQGLKVIFRIQRPWVLDKRLKVAKEAKAAATGYSFPSGHTQGSTGLFASLAMNYKKKWLYFASFAIIALVMFSRLYLGCHAPKDVLVSFAITFASVCLIEYIFSHCKGSDKTDIIVLIAVEIVSIAILIIAANILWAGKTTKELSADAFKTAGSGIGFGIGWFIEKKFVHYNPKSINKIWAQIVKFAVGILGALAAKESLKLIWGDSLVAAVIRYAFAIIWILAIFPAILTKVKKK